MLLNEIQLAVLEEFLGSYGGSFTGSDIARGKKLNQKSVANALNKLEDEGILKSRTVGKNKEFSMNLDNPEPVKNIIVAAEHIRAAGFLKKNPLVREAVAKLKREFDGIMVIFGSYAKGIQKKDSDVDIFIAGNYSRRNVSEISELYNLQISVKKYSAAEFRSALRSKDILVVEVMKNHIIVAGAEEFVDAVMRDYYGKN